MTDPTSMINTTPPPGEPLKNTTLCENFFMSGGECTNGDGCEYAHRIGDLKEHDQIGAGIPRQKGKRLLFKNLSIWVSAYILSFLNNSEILKFRTVNKEARFVCQKAYSVRTIDLHKINLETVKFFERAQLMNITEESLKLFDNFSNKFFDQIISHYGNLRTVQIDLGMCFDPKQKERLFSILSARQLNNKTETFKLIRTEVTQQDIDTLLSHSFLENTRHLILSMNNLMDDHLSDSTLLSSDILKNMKTLDLSSNFLTTKGVKQLCECEHLYNLTSLNLSYNKEIGNKGAMILAKSKAFPKLQKLELCKCKITETGAEALANSEQFSQLRCLKLRDNEICHKGIRAFTIAKSMRNLKKLNLCKTEIGDAGLVSLLKGHNFVSSLQNLSLTNNDLTDSSIKVLAGCPFLQNLVKLDLGFNEIGNQGIFDLSDCDYISGITHLRLNDNQIKEEGVKFLSRSPTFSNLVSLNLQNNQFGEEGAIILSQSPQFAKLEFLDISQNEIGMLGCQAIAESDRFPQLITISINGNNLIVEAANKMLLRSKSISVIL